MVCEGALSRMSSLTCIPGVPTLFQAPGWAKALPGLGVHGLGHEELQDLLRPGCGSEGKRGPRRKAPGAGGGSREFQLAQGIEGPQGVWAAGVPWGHQHKDCLEGPERGEATPPDGQREKRGPGGLWSEKRPLHLGVGDLDRECGQCVFPRCPLGKVPN